MPRFDVPRDFGFTDDHALLAQSARRFLRERWAKERLRALYDDGAHDPTLFPEIAALGWLDHRAFGYLGAALLAEEAGRVLCPAPIASSIVAHDVLSRAGATERAAQIERGALVAHAEAIVDPSGVVAGVHRDARLVLVARTPTTWAAIELGDGVAVDTEETIDPTRSGVRLHPDEEALAGAPALTCDLAREEVFARSLTLLAAECCGAAEAALAMTRDYAIERKQFNRPIGTFQAVSHPIVDTMIAIEQARSLTLAAAAAIDASASEGPREVGRLVTLARMAKAAASDALRDATARGVQLHGGFGFTWDCDMHFYFRRSLYDHAMLGTPAEHRAALLATLLTDD